MSTDFIDFDPGEKPIDVKIDYQPPSSPITLNEEDPLRHEIYDLAVRGYPPASIVQRMAGKITLKIAQVRQILDDERASRQQYREQVATGSLQDAIEYYQRMKTEAEDRAKYSDEKNAPEFLKIAMEAQNRIDKLLGHEGEKAGRLPGDGEIEGLGLYRLKARIVREEMPALEDTENAN